MLRMGSGHCLIQQLLHFSLGGHIPAAQPASMQGSCGTRISTFHLGSSAAACWLAATCLGLHLRETIYWQGEQACPFQKGCSQRGEPALFSNSGHNPTRAMP